MSRTKSTLRPRTRGSDEFTPHLSLTCGSYLAREFLRVFRRLQKNNCKRYRVSWRQLKTLQRFELLQLWNVLQSHAADDFRRKRVASPNGLPFNFFAGFVVNRARELNLAHDDRILIQGDTAHQKNFAVALNSLVTGSQ